MSEPMPPPATEKRPGDLFRKVGGFVMIGAALWWFFYYAQHAGAFTYLQYKLGCLYGDSQECSAYRDFIGGKSALPVYSPIAWWIGVAGYLAGTLMNRRKS